MKKLLVFVVTFVMSAISPVYAATVSLMDNGVTVQATGYFGDAAYDQAIQNNDKFAIIYDGYKNRFDIMMEDGNSGRLQCYVDQESIMFDQVATFTFHATPATGLNVHAPSQFTYSPAPESQPCFYVGATSDSNKVYDMINLDAHQHVDQSNEHPTLLGGFNFNHGVPTGAVIAGVAVFAPQESFYMLNARVETGTPNGYWFKCHSSSATNDNFDMHAKFFRMPSIYSRFAVTEVEGQCQLAYVLVSDNHYHYMQIMPLH